MGGADKEMIKTTWDDEGRKMFCSRCLWRDDKPDLCHSVEPPINNEWFSPSSPSDCYFIPKDRFDIWPKERKDRIYQEREERSKRYWAKH